MIYFATRKLFLLLLVLLLPLQGTGAAFAPLDMALHPTIAAMPCHEPVHEGVHDALPDVAAVDHVPSPETPRDAEAVNHLCCHVVVSCAPPGTPGTSAHKFADVSNWVLPLATLYIPDSPYRPPRA